MILAIDTSEKLTKIYLLEDDFSVISGKEYTLNGELSERLLLEIDKLLKAMGKNKKYLSKILVNEGPGSYTGLRIGVTTANFLAFSLNIPVFSYKIDQKSKKIKILKKRLLDVDKFDSPVLPFYNKPPHITKPVLPS